MTSQEGLIVSNRRSLARSSALVVALAGIALATPACASYVNSEAPTPTPATGAVNPAPQDLQQTLQTVTNSEASLSDREAVVEGGPALAPALEALESAQPGYGAITYQVTNVHRVGDSATATVVANSPKGVAPLQTMTWHEIDGHWQLDNAGTCLIAKTFAQFVCTPEMATPS